MNKTVNQSSNHCNWILSLALMNRCPNVFVISLTLETHGLFETRIGCEELPTMMFQQIVFSFPETARVKRCHEQFSTTNFLLSSKVTQLARRQPAQIAGHFQFLRPPNCKTAAAYSKTFEKSVWFEDCKVSSCSVAQLLGVRTMPSEVRSENQPRSFSRVCASWFPTRSDRKKGRRRNPTLLHGFCQTRRIRAADFDKITSINNCRVQHGLNLFWRCTSLQFSVPSVPTDSSQAFFHHQSIFPSYSDPFRLKDAHDKEVPTTSHR